MTSLSEDAELVSDFVLESNGYLDAVEHHLLQIEKNAADSDSLNAVFRAFHTIKGLAGFLEFNAIKAVAHDAESTLERVRSGEAAMSPAIIDTVLRAKDYLKGCLGALSGQETRECGLRAAEQTSLRGPETATQSSVKVETHKLEYLVEMVSEMVIAQRMVRDAAPGTSLDRNLALLTRVTGEVQKTAMSMRMVPVRHLFAKMERLVRDLAKKSGKHITLEVSGERSELDRLMVEELADPLVHMIRNSVDHGIEKTGVIRLSAHHEAGLIVIQLSDDGRGLNKARILAKAISRKIISDQAQPSDAEIFRLIFQPGFSTAEQVTDISGRGVGMDVVLRHIQKLRGQIDIHSAEGAGCNFTFRLPLTLATIDGLIVGVGSERFIVPIYAVKEIFSAADPEDATILHRGTVFPLLRLRALFDIEDPLPPGNVIIVIHAGNRQFCLGVDRLIGKQEVIIKSLGSCFQNLPGIAGGAILGDGLVALILDVHTI